MVAVQVEVVIAPVLRAVALVEDDVVAFFGREERVITVLKVDAVIGEKPRSRIHIGLSRVAAGADDSQEHQKAGSDGRG